MLKAGLYLPCGVGASPEPCFIDTYEDIQSHVGGVFDVVVSDLNGEDGVQFVGYIHDEGRILNLEMNYLATALFTQEIRGGVVVLWGLNENGYADGESYDIPEDMAMFLCKDLVEFAASTYNDAVIMDIFLGMAVQKNLATGNEIAELKLSLYKAATEGDYDSLMRHENRLRVVLTALRDALADDEDAQEVLAKLDDMTKSLGDGPLFGKED